MTKTKGRPALTSISDRLAQKPAAASPVPAPEASKPGKVDERVQVIVRVSEVERKALRQIALDQDTTVQALAEEAIRDVIARNKK